MTTITIDPPELSSAASLLRSCSTEAADIGTALSSCIDCAMPAEIRNLVDRLVAAADRALDVSASQLNLWGNDLANRSQIALTDTLTAGLITNGYGATPTASFGSGAGVILGGFSSYGTTSDGSAGLYPSAAIIGGTSFTDGITIGSNGFLPSAAIIGGTSFSDGVTIGGSAVAGPGVAIIGGPGAGANNPFRALDELIEKKNQSIRTQVNAIFSNRNSTPYELAVAGRASDSINYNINHTLAPSERELEDRYGPLTDSAIRSLSPYTLPNPHTNILLPVF